MIPFAEECSRNGAYNYMPRIAVVSQAHYLQVVATTYSSTADLAVQIPLLPYYEELLTADDYDFSTGIISDPFHRAGRKVLPMIRPITYQYNNKQAGYLFIEVSTDLFTVPLKDYSCPSMTAYLYLYDCRITLIYMKTNGLREFTPEYSLSAGSEYIIPSPETRRFPGFTVKQRANRFWSQPLWICQTAT